MNEETNCVVKMCNSKLLTTMQQKVSGNIVSGEENKIAKVLSVRACPNINGKEVYLGGVKASLDVFLEAVVCLESGEIVCSEQIIAKASIVYENSLIAQNSDIKICATVMDNETVISQGEVTINTLVNLDIYLKGNRTDFLPPKIDDSVNIKSADNIVCSFKDKISASGMIKGEIPVDNKFKKVIFATYTGYLKNFDIKTDYFVINGEMLASFLCEYEDGQLKSFVKNFDFSEEVEQKGILQDDILQLDFKTAFKPNTNIVVGANGESSIDVEMPYTLTGEIYTCYNQEVIVDAYDTSREVKLTTESFDQSICKCSCFAEEKIIAGFNLSEDAPRVERILGTASENISLVNTVVKQGEMILEGIANVCVVYYSEDEEGNKVLNSVLIDLPYSLNISNKEIAENDLAEVCLKLGEISVKNKKGRELEVVANVFVCYNLSSPTISAFTTEITLGEEKQNSPYALEIVVAKENETLWDIAKRLSVKEELLVAQNSDITLPLVGGEKLVVFRSQNNK